MKLLPKRPALAAFLATAAFASLPLVPAVQAGSGIQRCESASGEAIYTDKACATFDARAVPMSGELLVRLAHEQTRAPEGASTMADDIVAPAPGPARRSVAAGCARTPTQLAMDLRGAFALGDVNTTIIRSASGATVTLTYDVQSPRPYDLALRIQGTRGIYEMARDSV